MKKKMLVWLLFMGIIGVVPVGLAVEVDSKVLEVPYVVYQDADSDSLFWPSGWMGNFQELDVDFAHSQNPAEGARCMRVVFRAEGGWAGIAWQYPKDDWANLPLAINLSAASKLRCMIRGDQGGEVVSLKYGILNKNVRYPESASDELEAVKLSQDWQEISFDLAGKDLTKIKTGFCFVVEGQGKPVTFYIDAVRYE